jgi:hypothetical protein
MINNTMPRQARLDATRVLHYKFKSKLIIQDLTLGVPLGVPLVAEIRDKFIFGLLKLIKGLSYFRNNPNIESLCKF